MDKIIIKNLQCKCVIGDYAWERKRPQKIHIDVEVETNLGPASRQDKLDATMVDYNRLAKEVLLFVQNSSCHLIEALAEQVAQLCLEKFPVEAVKIRLAKPGAIRAADHAQVEIYRQAQYTAK